MGSTLLARRAGKKDANNATTNSIAATAASTSGSLGLTWNNRLCATRPSASASANPTPNPISVGLSPCPSTMLTT